MRVITRTRANRRRCGGGATALLVALALGAAAPLGAQQERERERECRCVNDAGERIEECFCVRTPRLGMDSFMGFDSERPVLGVGVRGDQPDADDRQGARVYSVEEGGPAAAAGLREGDLIARVGGRTLTDPLPAADEDALGRDGSRPVQRLLALLGDREAGDEVEVEYLRDGERRVATVELGEPRFRFRFEVDRDRLGRAPRAPMPPRPTMPARPGMPMPPFAWSSGSDCPVRVEETGREDDHRVRVFAFGRSCVAGVELMTLSPGLAGYFGAPAGAVLIADAGEDNALGLEAGDVLLAVDGRELRDLDHARRVLGSYDEGEEVDLRVLRRERTVELRGRVR